MEVSIISRDELKKLIDSKGKYVLIDVREEDELKHGMIPTAKNVPMSEFNNFFDLNEKEFKEKFGFDKPKKNDNVIFYCRSGSRSHFATEVALKKGYKKAKNYFGSTNDWAEIDSNVEKY